MNSAFVLVGYELYLEKQHFLCQARLIYYLTLFLFTREHEVVAGSKNYFVLVLAGIFSVCLQQLAYDANVV